MCKKLFRYALTIFMTLKEDYYVISFYYCTLFKLHYAPSLSRPLSRVIRSAYMALQRQLKRASSWREVWEAVWCSQEEDDYRLRAMLSSAVIQV